MVQVFHWNTGNLMQLAIIALRIREREREREIFQNFQQIQLFFYKSIHLPPTTKKKMVALFQYQSNFQS